MANNVHQIKAWPEYYDALVSGEKTFEVRLNDRNYQTHDRLDISKFSPSMGFMGERSIWDITYILHGGNFGVEAGYVVMSVALLQLFK